MIETFVISNGTHGRKSDRKLKTLWTFWLPAWRQRTGSFKRVLSHCVALQQTRASPKPSYYGFVFFKHNIQRIIITNNSISAA